MPIAHFELALVSLQQTIAESQARISADPLPTAFVDEVQLVQLFQNRVSDVIKYRRGERPEIHVKAESRGAIWTSAVTDNGIGIEPRFARSIIEVFKRLHNRKEFPGPVSASLFASASSNGTVSAVAMQVMWDEVAQAVSPGTHAVST